VERPSGPGASVVPRSILFLLGDALCHLGLLPQTRGVLGAPLLISGRGNPAEGVGSLGLDLGDVGGDAADPVLGAP